MATQQIQIISFLIIWLAKLNIKMLKMFIKNLFYDYNLLSISIRKEATVFNNNKQFTV